MPTAEQRQSVLKAIDTLSPDEWIAMIRYMARELASTDQPLLSEIICREAERRAERTTKEFKNSTVKYYPADHIASVLRDVEMQIVPA